MVHRIFLTLHSMNTGSSAHKKLVATTAPVTDNGKADSKKKGKPVSEEEGIH